MKSPATREKYVPRLARFFEFLGIEGNLEEQCRDFAQRGRTDSKWAFGAVVKYLQHHLQRVERKEITAATLRNHVKTIKLFCEMADIQVPWKRIAKGLPRGRKYAPDRAPTIHEMQKTAEYPDRRIRAIIYTMASSGIRLGAWDYLRWGDVESIFKGRKLLAAKLTVYAGEEDQYYTFITPEAYPALADWMRYREQSGEAISRDSWLVRDLWDVAKPKGAGFVSVPKRLKSTGVKRLNKVRAPE